MSETWPTTRCDRNTTECGQTAAQHSKSYVTPIDVCHMTNEENCRMTGLNRVGFHAAKTACAKTIH